MSDGHRMLDADERWMRADMMMTIYERAEGRLMVSRGG